MVQREVRCTGPRLGTRIVVQFWATLLNQAESELSESFETRCVSLDFTCFRTCIFEVRPTHAVKPWKIPETWPKRQRMLANFPDQSRDRSWCSRIHTRGQRTPLPEPRGLRPNHLQVNSLNHFQLNSLMWQSGRPKHYAGGRQKRVVPMGIQDER